VRATLDRDDAFECYFPYFLCAIVIAAAVPRLRLGVAQPINVDGFWNIFTDTQDRWALLLSENQRDEHPMLYRLVLRTVAHFGNSRLVYRSASIIPGLATVYMIGLIGWKIRLRKSVALLAAVSYGFSTTIIENNCEVRAYPLAILFMVIAFYHLIGFLTPRRLLHRKRSLVWFAVMTSLAITTEFYSILFLISCGAFLFLMSIRYPHFRREMLLWARVRGHPLLLAFGLPSAVAISLYFIQERPRIFRHIYLTQFYWDKKEPVLHFVARNVASETNFMAPIELRPPALTMTLAVLAAVVIFYVSFAPQRPRDMAAKATLLMSVFLVGGLILFSIARRYPFGGEARHQSIIFPFMTLAAFVAFDRSMTLIPSATWRTAMVGMLTLLTGLIIWSRWRNPIYFEEDYSPEVRAFKTNFPDTSAVYVDQFSLLTYFAHTYNSRWKFERHYYDGDAIDAYQVVDSSNEHIELLRNLNHFFFDLDKPGFYSTARRAMVDAGLNSLTLFFVNPDWHHMDTASLDETERIIRQRAGDAGLSVGAIVCGDAEAFVTFNLR
jgi:transmembrane protein TMEM260 (protein O-mannosyltransferase)